MENLPKEKAITNSLLFFLLRDALPIKFARFEYTIEDFKRDRDELIKGLHEFLDGIDADEEKLFTEKEAKDQGLFNDLILSSLNNRLKDILKEDYYQFFKSSIPKKLRIEILERDEYKCQYCGLDLMRGDEMGFSAHVDHIKPQRSGGKHNPENLLTCCWKCNLGKRDFDLFEYEDDINNEP
jgi:5-methylcytosine-specific restriction endonuclease McrA